MAFTGNDPVVGFVGPDEEINQTPDFGRMAAVAGGGGFVTNPSLSASDQLKGIGPDVGIAASIVAPEVLLAAVPELSPAAATGVGAYLKRLGILGAVSGAAGATSEEAIKALNSQTTPSEAAKNIALQTGVGALAAPVLGGLGQKLLQSFGGSLKNLVGTPFSSLGEAFSSATKGFKRGFARPLFETQQELQSQAARELIKNATGLDVPESTGEILGKTALGRSYLDVEKEMGKNASGTISDEARNEAAKRVLHTASKLIGTGAEVPDIAQATVAAIESDYGIKVGKPLQDAIEDMTKDLATRLRGAAEKSGLEANALIGEGSGTAYQIGQLEKQLSGESQTRFRDQTRQAYDAYRSALGKDAMAKEGLPKTAKAIEEIENTALKQTTATGETVPIERSLPGDVAGDIATLKKAASTPQRIEDIGQFASDLNDSITYGPMSKIPDRLKKMLRTALNEDRMDAIEALPNSNAKQLLIDANRKYAGTDTELGVEEILNRSVTQAGKDVASGGTSPESLYKAITGTTSTYNKFRDLFGQDFEPFKQLLRDSIVAEGRSGAASLEGEVNLGKLVQGFDRLPPEIRNDLFPNLDKIRKLAATQIKASKLVEESKGKDPLDWISANKDEVAQFLGPEGEQKFQNALQVRIATQQALKSEILNAVEKGRTGPIAANAPQVMEQILKGTLNKGERSAVLDLVRNADPRTYHDLQVEYLSRLLQDSKTGPLIDAKKILEKLAEPVAGAAPSSGGSQLPIAKELLGPAKLAQIREMGKALETLQKPLLGRFSDEKSTLQYLASDENAIAALYPFMSKVVGIRSLGYLTRLMHMPSHWRYRIAAEMIDNPELVRLSTKPIKSLTGAEAATISSALAEQVADQVMNTR